MTKKFHVEGFRKLERSLAALSGVRAKASARRILRKAAKPIKVQAAASAPYLSGDLEGSYKIATKLNRRQRKLNPKKSEVEIHVGPTNPAGLQTEFGNKHQAPDPHLRPAWDAGKMGALNTIRGEFGAEIARTVARVKSK